MKKITFFSFIAGFLLLATACKKDEDTTGTDLSLDSDLNAALSQAATSGNLSEFLLPDSDDFSRIPQDPLNPLTKEKVALGKLLYHETGLALAPMQTIGTGTYSCASCHFASAGFQAGRFQGIADGGIGFGINGEGREKGALYAGDDIDVQPLRTPTTLNVAYQKNMLWNGQFGATGLNVGTEAQWTPGTPIETNNMGFEGVEIQAIAGLNVHRLKIEESFLAATSYKALFDEVYANLPTEERYTRITAGLAIAAYERTLLANQAPFQQWLKGNKAVLTEQEKRGAILFFTKAECASCHQGPALNAMEFHAIGVKDLIDCPEEVFRTGPQDSANLGRGSFTKLASDNYKFKVPQLYNLSDSPFYGHGSSFRSIAAVVRYKNEGIAENANVPTSQLADEFQPLGLSQAEIDDITAFLDNGLRDPNLKRFEPTSIPSGNCFPNNDPTSRIQLGCD